MRIKKEIRKRRKAEELTMEKALFGASNCQGDDPTVQKAELLSISKR